ncbi:hypothetical protein VPH35_001893 [Triticum aestivum]
MVPVAPPPPARTISPAGHGSSLTRNCSPRSTRRRSSENLMPLASPPLSPTSVLRSPPLSRRSLPSAPLDVVACPDLIDLCAPAMMLRPLVSLYPVRPPGFEASPTPPLPCVRPLRRTPSPMRASQGVLGLEGLESLFIPGQQALLDVPPSPPAIPATARRKTLAGLPSAAWGAQPQAHCCTSPS